eukprot:403344084
MRKYNSSLDFHKTKSFLSSLNNNQQGNDTKNQNLRINDKITIQKQKGLLGAHLHKHRPTVAFKAPIVSQLLSQMEQNQGQKSAIETQIEEMIQNGVEGISFSQELHTKIATMLLQVTKHKQQFDQMIKMMPSLIEQETENNGWAKIYKMLISPFSNNFKKYIEAKLKEKRMQQNELDSDNIQETKIFVQNKPQYTFAIRKHISARNTNKNSISIVDDLLDKKKMRNLRQEAKDKNLQLKLRVQSCRAAFHGDSVNKKIESLYFKAHIIYLKQDQTNSDVESSPSSEEDENIENGQNQEMKHARLSPKRHAESINTVRQLVLKPRSQTPLQTIKSNYGSQTQRDYVSHRRLNMNAQQLNKQSSEKFIIDELTFKQVSQKLQTQQQMNANKNDQILPDIQRSETQQKQSPSNYQKYQTNLAQKSKFIDRIPIFKADINQTQKIDIRPLVFQPPQIKISPSVLFSEELELYKEIQPLHSARDFKQLYATSIEPKLPVYQPLHDNQEFQARVNKFFQKRYQTPSQKQFQTLNSQVSIADSEQLNLISPGHHFDKEDSLDFEQKLEFIKKLKKRKSKSKKINQKLQNQWNDGIEKYQVNLQESQNQLKPKKQKSTAKKIGIFDKAVEKDIQFLKIYRSNTASQPFFSLNKLRVKSHEKKKKLNKQCAINIQQDKFEDSILINMGQERDQMD